jgi:hypothetical protein
MKIVAKDWLFLALVGCVIVIVILVSGKETTRKVPYDKVHSRYYDILKQTGSKRAAEKDCESCHNEKMRPLPKNHPAKNRCLFCHKMQLPEK